MKGGFKFERILIFLLALTIPTSIVLAWNKPGHMISAAIAYTVLEKESPGIIGKVAALLREHPSYESMWKTRLESVSMEDRDLYLFMLAARWPDDMRGESGFEKFNGWHQIDLPYKPDGQPVTVQTTDPQPENIQSAYGYNLGVMKSNQADGAQRAVALCWLFHLIGDVHQPLHTISLFTTEFPHGDFVAVQFYIRTKPDKRAISLHKFWDGLVFDTVAFKGVRNRAIKLYLRPGQDKRKELTELRSHKTFSEWLKDESFELAKKGAYREGSLLGSSDKKIAPVLPSDYAAEVKPIAERRIVLAGYRLADVLEECLR